VAAAMRPLAVKLQQPVIAGARRSDQSPAPTTLERSSSRRYSFDDESQQFDWSATLNLLSRLDDRHQSTTGRPSDAVDTGPRQRQRCECLVH